MDEQTINDVELLVQLSFVSNRTPRDTDDENMRNLIMRTGVTYADVLRWKRWRQHDLNRAKTNRDRKVLRRYVKGADLLMERIEAMSQG